MTTLSTGLAETASRYEPIPTIPDASRVATSIVNVIDPEGDVSGVYRSSVNQSIATDVRFFSSPQEYLRSENRDRPGCLIVRFQDGGQGVRVLQHEMSRSGVELPLIVTTDGTTFTTAAGLMENGAFTVLQHPPAINALRQYIDMAIAEDRSRCDLQRRYREVTAILRRLTPRQRKVLELADSGLPNKKIAAELDVSIRTIEVDRSNIMKAFEVRSLASVTRRIGELQILSLWHSHWRFSRPKLRIQRPAQADEFVPASPSPRHPK